MFLLIAGNTTNQGRKSWFLGKVWNLVLIYKTQIVLFVKINLLLPAENRTFGAFLLLRGTGKF